MCIKAIRLNGMKDDMKYVVLACLCEKLTSECPTYIDFKLLADELGTSRQEVSFSVKRLVSLGYIIATSAGLKLSDKIINIEE